MPTRDDIRDVIDARMFELLGSAYTPNRAAIKANLLDAVATGIVAWPGTGGGPTVHTDTVDPDENADETAGYDYGSTWINTATPEEFVCVDPTNGAAVWLSTTSGISAVAAGVIAVAAASSAMSAHTGAADPHTQYALETSLATVATTGAFSDLTGIPAAVASLSGTNTGDQTITLTGDVTGSGTGSFATTLASTAVTPGTYGGSGKRIAMTVDAKGRVTSASDATMAVADIAASATSRVFGRTTAGPGAGEELTPADVAALLAAISGRVVQVDGPASGAATTGSITIPTWATTARVILIAAGGAGGSGRRGPAGSICGAGAGGAGGSLLDVTYDAATLRALGSTIDYSLGAPGTPGPAITTNGTVGTAGTPGTNSFATVGAQRIAHAVAGAPGAAGTTTAASAASAAANWPTQPVWRLGGDGGGGATAGAGTAGTGTQFGGGGGGGGGGGISATPTRRDGGAGGRALSGSDADTTGGAAGTGAGGLGSAGNGWAVYGGDGGGGGAAGDTAGATAAGAGGAGQTPGGGGGGGGGSRDGANSGAGGSGGKARIRVEFS